MLVLARTIEEAGVSTVLVTMMPYWAEKIGVPRTLGVEFPYGYPLGLPREVGMQRQVIRQALSLLDTAEEPGAIDHCELEWPGEYDYWRKAWQPKEPSPIVLLMRDQIRAARAARQDSGEQSTPEDKDD